VYLYSLGQDMKRDALQTNQSRVTPTLVFVFMHNLNTQLSFEEHNPF